MPRLAAATLTHLTENVYLFPGDMRLVRPWVGVVITAEGTVLLDSGNGPTHAALIRKELAALGAPPVTHILLTHHHWDHVFGNHFFPGAHIVAHEQTQHHLKIMAEEPWSEAYMDEKAASFPNGPEVARIMQQAVPDWSLFRAVPAHETFTERYDLALGGSHFQMEHVGGQHEPDQCIIHVQPANVLFLGDATYGRGPRERWNREALSQELSAFLARGADWYVEGHRAPSPAARFAQRIG